MNEYLKVGLGYERLFFFLLISFILVHIVACLWVIVASFNSPEGDYSGTWVEANGATKFNIEELYILSLYWTVTTVTTVGYGDISGVNTLERIFCSIIMLVGVIAFSFANGILSSIISNSD